MSSHLKISRNNCSTEIDLNKRIEYLSRAVVCVKSGESSNASDSSGDILHGLEEKMEVARVQVLKYSNYSGDLNTRLVWYSNGQKLSDR